mmetsp:Transcript_22017/g.44193  ORF Transcript_22017/g.44193 Transcript_22017/m.44193 type:complete len:397 (-) Transcript_22017:453-1643(-)
MVMVLQTACHFNRAIAFLSQLICDANYQPSAHHYERWNDPSLVRSISGRFHVFFDFFAARGREVQELPRVAGQQGRVISHREALLPELIMEDLQRLVVEAMVVPQVVLKLVVEVRDLKEGNGVFVHVFLLHAQADLLAAFALFTVVLQELSLEKSQTLAKSLRDAHEVHLRQGLPSFGEHLFAGHLRARGISLLELFPSAVHRVDLAELSSIHFVVLVPASRKHPRSIKPLKAGAVLDPHSESFVSLRVVGKLTLGTFAGENLVVVSALELLRRVTEHRDDFVSVLPQLIGNAHVPVMKLHVVAFVLDHLINAPFAIRVSLLLRPLNDLAGIHSALRAVPFGVVVPEAARAVLSTIPGERPADVGSPVRVEKGEILVKGGSSSLSDVKERDLRNLG